MATIKIDYRKDVENLGELQDYIGKLVAKYGRDRQCFVAACYCGGVELGIYLQACERTDEAYDIRYFSLDSVTGEV